MASRIGNYVRLYECIGNGTLTRQDAEYEERRAVEAANRYRQVQEAPVITEHVVSLEARAPPQVPPRPSFHHKYRQDTQQQSTPPPTPLRGSSLQDSQLCQSESESEPDSDRPPTPESPVTVSASRAPDSSTRPRNNHQARVFLTNDTPVQQLQAELDGIKREIDQIKLQYDESDRKVATLSAQLDEAQKRALEATPQNAGMRRVIREQRKMLRDAMQEEKRLHDEISDMMSRERRLLDQIRDSQASTPSQPPETPERSEHRSSRQKRSSKREDVEMVMVRPISLHKNNSKSMWGW